MKTRYFFLKLLVIFFWLFFTFTSCRPRLVAQGTGQPERMGIYVPLGMEKEVSEAIEDMVYWLRKAGVNVLVNPSGGEQTHYIFFRKANESEIASTIQKEIESSGQSFYLSAKGLRHITIIGKRKNSFINGIYTLLHELGFRWYMPGDTWTIVPNKLPDLYVDKLYVPDFRDRFYSGSGGMHSIPGLDEKNKVRSDFSLWNRRNRFSVDYQGKGHSGEQFYLANKTVLDKNPGYFCDAKVNRYGRINIDNRDAIQLYVQWAINQVKPGDYFPVIGVDPADGSGGKDDCLSTQNSLIKTWSDKYFWLANQVAERLKQDDDKTMVQLYAYASHADVPEFKLHKNVFPVIIPYAFQRVTTSQEFIRRWSQRLEGRPMGMYDYWNISQWSIGLPQFNIYNIQQKLKLWKQYNVTHINIESTTSKGPMGHALWLASQMMWNTGLSFDSLYNAFLGDCFGPAKEDIKRMYDRWSKNYQEQMEPALSLSDLEEAARKTSNRQVLDRITELKAYVYYIALYYKYQESPTTANYKELLDYMYRIHPLGLIQTTALEKSYIKKPESDKSLVVSPDPSFQKQSDQKRYQDINSLVENSGINKNKRYKTSALEFDITKVKSDAVSGKQAGALKINGPLRYEFFLSGKKELLFEAGASASTVVRVLNKHDSLLWQEEIYASKEGFQQIRLNLSSGYYVLLFGENYFFSRMRFPVDIAFLAPGRRSYDNNGYPIQYVYVPSDIDEIIYRDNYGPGINRKGYWLDPDGKRIDPEKLEDKIYRIPVPNHYKGKTWSLVMGHPGFRLLNIPDYTSLNPFIYQE